MKQTFGSDDIFMNNTEPSINNDTLYYIEEIRSQCYKAFFSRKLLNIGKRAFVAGKPFQPSLLFVGKTRSLAKSGTSERFFTRVGYSLTNKY